MPLAPVRFERLRLDDVGASGLAGLAGEAMVALEATQPGAAARSSSCASSCAAARRWRIACATPTSASSSAEELALALGALSAELRCEHLRPPLELDRHRGQPHLLGAALEIASRAAADDPLLDELAPAVLAGDDSGDPAARRAYLAELLAELDETLAEALLTRPRREDRPHPRRRLRPARRARARGPGRERPRRRVRPERGRQVEPARRSSPRCSTASRPPRARITRRHRSTGTPTVSSSWRCPTAITSASNAICVPARRVAHGAATRRRSSRTVHCPRSPGSSAEPTWRCMPSTPTSCAASTPQPGARSSSGCSAAHRPRSCAPPRSRPRNSRPPRTSSGATTGAASRARRS